MLTVFPFYEGDVDEMLDLMEWIHELGGCAGHDALLVPDFGTNSRNIMDVVRLADKSFSNVELITNGENVIGWIEGPKSLFLAASKYAHENKVPFLQMETDAIPLHANWLDDIALHYEGLDRRYLGHIYESKTPGFPERCLSGIAVYPYQVWEYRQAIREGRNWDLTLSNFVIPQSVNTPLIHHFWGMKDLPPTFRDRSIAKPINAFTLEDIPKEAVIWHRNKDGTLIKLLRKRFHATIGDLCQSSKT